MTIRDLSYAYNNKSREKRHDSALTGKDRLIMSVGVIQINFMITGDNLARQDKPWSRKIEEGYVCLVRSFRGSLMETSRILFVFKHAR